MTEHLQHWNSENPSNALKEKTAEKTSKNDYIQEVPVS